MSQIEQLMELADEYARRPLCVRQDGVIEPREALRAAITQALEAQHHHPVSPELEREIEQALTPGEPVAWPDGLIDRIKAAEQRIQDGHALRRIPADPTDVDLVLAEVRYLLEGKQPPFWIKTAPQPQPYDQQALELCEVCGWKTLIPGDGCLNCERKPQPQPEKRPQNCGTGFCSCIECPYPDHFPEAGKMIEPFGYFRSTLDGWEDCAETDEGARPLYEAPQPDHFADAGKPMEREWVGLTDEEIEDCWDGYLSDYQLQQIREISVKLREKNT